MKSKKSLLVITILLTLFFFTIITGAQSNAPQPRTENPPTKADPLPDLRIDNIRVPSCAAAGPCIVYRNNQPRFDFSITVINSGPTAAANSLLRVKWEAYNAAARIVNSGFFDAPVPALAPGRTSTHTFTMNTPAVPAVRCRLKPIADYDKNVRESNEANNMDRTFLVLIRP